MTALKKGLTHVMVSTGTGSHNFFESDVDCNKQNLGPLTYFNVQ